MVVVAVALGLAIGKIMLLIRLCCRQQLITEQQQQHKGQTRLLTYMVDKKNQFGTTIHPITSFHCMAIIHAYHRDNPDQKAILGGHFTS